MKQYRIITTLGGLVGLAAIAGLVFYGCAAPPQIGADPEVFRTVDALYTAITAQNEKLLDDCEKRLHAHREAGKLPTLAATELDRIIETARQGRRRPAAERLYAFMEGQRREGR